MNTAINFESESEFRYVLTVVKQIIAASKPSDNQAIMSHIYKTSSANMDLNHIDEVISSMLEKQLIYNKPSKKGSSYYIVEQLNENVHNNTNNTNDDQITNIDNSHELTINNDDNDEKSTEQCSRKPAISEDINTPTGL